ncbi:hypothetical protein FCM35_KLT21705 [Carex littledalei]|uniref:Uncharacterized protein n=1 Tax=Carex littledalei TaxID=544730 RepID=A0A833R8X2_9POAL|nr:hypothetical protein FCM35_KLT21705 [Carex littledalei]
MAQASLAAPLRRYCSQHLFSPFKPRHFLFPFSRTSSYSLSQAQALRPVVSPSDRDAIDWEEERSKAARLADRKSRNELKREARRAVQWGVELSKFSPSQIKRALKVASLEKEVYEALMLVKKAEVGPRRKVQLVQEGQSNDAAALMQAKRPLMRFLRSLSKRTDE